MSDIIFDTTDAFGDRLTVGTGDSSTKLYTEINEDPESQIELTEEAVRELRDALDKHLGEEPTQTTTDPEVAKLGLASQFGLRVKFAYQGDLDRKPVERRLEPDFVSDTHVAGESYDAGGESEGYRQFRLGRIHGKITVR